MHTYITMNYIYYIQICFIYILFFHNGDCNIGEDS